MGRIILHRIGLPAASSTLASDPPYYLRKDRWHPHVPSQLSAMAARLQRRPRVVCETEIKNVVAQ